MTRIRSILASVLAVLILFAGLGFGLVLTGFAVILGAAVALTARLAVPRPSEADGPIPDPQPEAAEAMPTAA